MHLGVTFDFFEQSDLVCKWIHIDQWEASLPNQIIWVLYLFQSDAGVCESVVSDVVRRDVDKYIL